MSPSKSAAYAATQAGEQTVQAFARTLGQINGLTVEQIIERALTFHPQITRQTLTTRVGWEPGFNRVAGQFHTTHGIRLHPGLRHSDHKNLVETFLHELAHAMQFYAYGEINHLASWWEMMHQLGQKPKRTHEIAECQGRLTPALAGLNAEDLGL